MIAALLRTPVRRIALAILLSVLVHAVILWLPYIRLPQASVQLPPLSVRLEPLPKPAEVIPDKPGLAKPEAVDPLAGSGDGTSNRPETRTLAAMSRTDETVATHPFPRHLQLTFAVYRDAGGLMTGEIRQQLDIHGGRYNLRSVRRTAGLASLRNSDQLIQNSRGRIVETGLQPEIFEQQDITGSGTQDLRVTFDRAAGKLRYSDRGETALPADAQDELSFMYQLSQVPMQGEFFPLPVSDATQLQQYQVEIGTKEEIATPMGRMPALHLRKMHDQGEAYFEIWLGLEYRLLPVRFRRMDGSGNMLEEFVISGIRAAEE